MLYERLSLRASGHSDLVLFGSGNLLEARVVLSRGRALSYIANYRLLSQSLEDSWWFTSSEWFSFWTVFNDLFLVNPFIIGVIYTHRANSCSLMKWAMGWGFGTAAIGLALAVHSDEKRRDRDSMLNLSFPDANAQRKWCIVWCIIFYFKTWLIDEI